MPYKPTGRPPGRPRKADANPTTAPSGGLNPPTPKASAVDTTGDEAAFWRSNLAAIEADLEFARQAHNASAVAALSRQRTEAALALRQAEGASGGTADRFSLEFAEMVGTWAAGASEPQQLVILLSILGMGDVGEAVAVAILDDARRRVVRSFGCDRTMAAVILGYFEDAAQPPDNMTLPGDARITRARVHIIARAVEELWREKHATIHAAEPTDA